MKPRIRCSQLPQLIGGTGGGCHGSLTVMPLVKRREGGEGWEGTLGHWIVANRLIKESGAVAPGEFPPADVPNTYNLPKMSEWIVDWMLRQVAEDFPPTYALHVEEYFEAEFDRFILTGHMDINGINAEGTDFIGADEKWTYKPVVPAELNDQVLGYLGLAKRNYPKLVHAIFKLYNPRNCEEDGFERVSSVELDAAGLDACVRSLEERINAALDDPMTLNSGLLQCAWCPVGIQCPAQRMELEFMKATLTPESLAAIKGTADDALLGDVIISARTIKRAIEDAETLLHSRLDQNPEIIAGNGTHISRKIEGGQYSIIDPVGAFSAVSSLISADRIPHVVKYSSDRLVDEIAASHKVPKGGKAPVTGKSIFDATVRPFFEQGERKKLIFSQ